ncbi:40S ribosomal protein S5-1 [Hordeum vulgare]|nr:40S ribosomal protein S5-1 [Hordeum vulgare]
MLHIRDVEGPKKTGSIETRLEAMEQQVFKCQGMVERGLNANHMMITKFTSNHKMDAIDIGKHLSRLYERVDQLQGQIYDPQNQNCEYEYRFKSIRHERNYRDCYAWNVMPMSDMKKWEKMHGIPVHPKVMGRPKKNRKKEPEEKKDKNGLKKISKHGVTMHCFICGVVDHNKKGHHNHLHDKPNATAQDEAEEEKFTNLTITDYGPLPESTFIANARDSIPLGRVTATMKRGCARRTRDGAAESSAQGVGTRPRKRQARGGTSTTRGGTTTPRGRTTDPRGRSDGRGGTNAARGWRSAGRGGTNAARGGRTAGRGGTDAGT